MWARCRLTTCCGTSHSGQASQLMSGFAEKGTSSLGGWSPTYRAGSTLHAPPGLAVVRSRGPRLARRDFVYLHSGSVVSGLAWSRGASDCAHRESVEKLGEDLTSSNKGRSGWRPGPAGAEGT